MTKRIPVLLVRGAVWGFAVLFAWSACAASPIDPRDPKLSATERLDALVERIKTEQAKVRTLEASFVQKQASEFLLAPEESRGRFSYQAPDRVRWEYDSPKPITLVIDGKTMTTWYRDLGRAEAMTIGRYSERVLKYLGATGSIETLLEYFDVRAAFPADSRTPYRLEMTPRFARIAKRLKSLTLWIDSASFLPVEIHYVGGDGSLTEYSFRNPTINAELPADRFELKLPPEVAVKVVDMDRGQ
jgi:outer membrane lipoprotein-sorting protein